MICRLRCITRSSRLLTGRLGGHQVTEATLAGEGLQMADFVEKLSGAAVSVY
jgi:hypothetical protein